MNRRNSGRKDGIRQSLFCRSEDHTVGHKCVTDAFSLQNSLEKGSEVPGAALELEQKCEVRGVFVKTPAAWLAEIKDVFARGRAHNLELARVVYAAKCRLRFGQWTQMSSQLPFARRKGYLLVAVGKGLGNLNVHDRARLPSALKALYVLAQLDRTVLLNLIIQRAIHPGLTVQDAEELLALGKGKSKASARGVSIKRRLSKFEEFVRTTLQDWTPADRERARLAFLQFAEEIACHGNAAAVQPGCSADFQSAASPIFNRQTQEIATAVNTAAVPEPHVPNASPMTGSQYLVSLSLEVLKLRPQLSL